MPSPFPGMDPYLETPRIWPDVHHELISQIRSELNPRLPSHYVARVELRVYRTDQDDPGIEVIIPDLRIEEAEVKPPKKTRRSNGAALAIAEPEVISLLLDEIKEASLEIRERNSDALVAIIEVLSPANKVNGAYGRERLIEKRRNARNSEVHWIEIDLLRAGVPTVTPTLLRPSHYRAILYRGDDRRCRYWPMDLREPLSIIGIPLRGSDPDVPLDLQKALRSAYEHAAYERSIDYTEDADPPLTGADRTWANKVLREKGLR